MYKLKKYYSIWRAGSLICVGLQGTKKYVEIPYTEENYKSISTLVSSGVSAINIKAGIYQLFYNKGMLDKYDLQKNRKELFFEYLDIPITTDIYDKKIVVFGGGAIGSTVTYLLAQFGFKNIMVIDGDDVESTDIEKSLIFRKSDIGMKKVDAIKKTIKENFNIDIITEPLYINGKKNLEQLISNYLPSFVIKSADPDLSFRLYLNDICFDKNISFIFSAYSYEYIKIGPLFIPGLTCCDHGNNNYIKNLLGNDFDFYKQKKLFEKETIHPSISFNVNIAANLLVKEVVFYLLGRVDLVKTVSTQVIMDTVEMRAYKQQNVCNTDCKFCPKN